MRIPPLRAGALHPRDAAGAVVGAGRLVGLRAAAELPPDERQDAVGAAARLEVGLEGGQACADLGERLAEVLGLVVMGVELASARRRSRPGSRAAGRACPASAWRLLAKSFSSG